MPQLNPNPWFLILLISWFSLILLFFTKLLSTTPLLPLPNLNNNPTIPNWIWLWT
uniref:ATP synthase complex subunit 8 n=1 Tax=Varanus komodoensis TaxID=61221 RepID=Q6I7T1_VARKO|nr:ATPase subunit 8 [Varanus komodoensis]